MKRPRQLVGWRVLISTLLLCSCLPLLSGCATVFSGRTEEIALETIPPGARVTIIDQNGRVAHSGRTPMTVRLDKRVGYLQGADYKVDLELEGYEPRRLRVERGVSPWYFGNAILPMGSLLGLVLVDPWTGCMWSLRIEETEVRLRPLEKGETR